MVFRQQLSGDVGSTRIHGQHGNGASLDAVMLLIKLMIGTLMVEMAVLQMLRLEESELRYSEMFFGVWTVVVALINRTMLGA